MGFSFEELEDGNLFLIPVMFCGKSPLRKESFLMLKKHGQNYKMFDFAETFSSPFLSLLHTVSF